MARTIHVTLGAVLLLIYLYFIAHVSRYFPELAAAHSAGAGGRASRGLLIVYGLPLCAIACFFFPTRLKWWLSPRTPPLDDYLLGEGFWYFMGYALALLSVGVAMLFR